MKLTVLLKAKHGRIRFAVLAALIFWLLVFAARKPARVQNGTIMSSAVAQTSSISNDSAFAILREISPSGQLIVTSATCGYMDMLLNWIAQLQSIHVHNFLVIAEDLQTYEFLLTVIPRQTLMSSAFGRPFGQAGQKAAVFNSSDYSWCSRPYYLNKIIQQNITAIWIDSDAMLLRDPFAVVPDTEEDIIVTDDEPILEPILDMPHYYCSCFVKVRPTLGATAVLSMWARQCGSRSRNQPALNEALDIMAGKVKWHVLPRRLYPCGYDADRLTFAGALGWESPAWVHANWRVGAESKELFLKRVGMWRNLRAPLHCGSR